MSEFDILTINTPVIKASRKNSVIALVRGKPQIYHKEFDITEFIGEKLASIRGVKSVHYFPICFGNYRRSLLDSKVSNDRDNIRVGSYNFKLKGIKYVSSLYVHSYYSSQGLEHFANSCPTELNRLNLINEHLEMEALDTYMGQKDRRANIYYEYHLNGEIHLAPLFDYENSMFELLKDEVYYSNDFHEYKCIDDYKRKIDIYPQFGEYLSSYMDVDLVRQIEAMALERGFDLTNFDLEPYKRFDESTHKKLELILK